MLGGGCCGCKYIVSCGMQYQDANNAYEVAICDSSAPCNTIGYQISTRECRLFTTEGAAVANSDFDVAVYNSFCKNLKCCG